MERPLKPSSIAAQALGWEDATTRAIAPPIHLSTTFIRDPDNQFRSGRIYARDHNPTFDQAEAVLTALEGGHASLLFASGMAAATAVFQALAPGDHVLVPKVMYWSLRNWLLTFATHWGLQRGSHRHDRSGRVRGALQPGKTRLVWIETPANPLWTHHRYCAQLRYRACGGRDGRRRLDRGHTRSDAPARAGRGPRHALGDQVSERSLGRDRGDADGARGFRPLAAHQVHPRANGQHPRTVRGMAAHAWHAHAVSARSGGVRQCDRRSPCTSKGTR